MRKKKYAACLLAILFLIPINVRAEAEDRKGSREFFAFGQAMSGDSITGSSFWVDGEFKISPWVAGGLGFGFNLTKHINLNACYFVGTMDFEGLYSTETYSGPTQWTRTWTAVLLGGYLNIDLNILKGPLTPMVTGGIGFINARDNGEGETFTESDLSYTLGGGIRWDVTEHLLLKALCRYTGIMFEDADSMAFFTGIGLSLGYMFN